MNPASASPGHIPVRLPRALLVMSLLAGPVGCGGTEEEWDASPALVEGEQLANTEQEVTNGAVNAACAESLTLRNSPGGSVIGTMYTNHSSGISKFYVSSTSGSWSYGYSYSLGRWGYAMAYYLTTSYGESGTPGVAPYNWWCTRSDGTSIGGGIG